jgi:4-amino-4-deoxy-L-arabinose transferase-like glycosyltransferase
LYILPVRRDKGFPFWGGAPDKVPHEKEDCMAQGVNISSVNRRLVGRIGLISGLILLAVLLRLWQIEDQSLTTDEFVTYFFEPNASLDEYRDVNAFRLSDNPPVYVTILWYWVQILGNSPVLERLPSVVCGVVTAMLIYLLGCRAYGRTAGALALCLYALSPFHIFHDQGIRPYALLMTMSVASLLLTDRLAGAVRWRRWLLPHWLVNALLVYTHPMGGLILLFEGIYLLVLWRTRILRVAAWGLPLFLCVLPVLGAISVPEEDPRWAMPDWAHTLANMFATDTIRYNIELTPSHENWAYQLPGQDHVQAVYPALSVALATLFAAGALGGLWAAYSRGRRKPRQGELKVRPSRLPWLLVMVALLPAPLLAVLSVVLEPMPMPRYTLFSGAGLYVLAGGAISALPLQWARRAAGATLIALMAVQLLWLMPAGVRTEFYAATGYVAKHRQPQEPVYTTLSPDIFYIHFPIKVDLDRATPALLGFHTRDHAAEYQAEHTMRDVADEAFRHFNALQPEDRHSQSAWVIVMRLYEYGPALLLEDELARRGLSFEGRHWYAYEGISVYRISAPAALVSTPAPETPRDWMAFLAAHDIEVPDRQPQSLVAATLDSCLDRVPEPFGTASEYASLSFILGSKNLALARNTADAGLRAHPNDGGLYVARSYIRLALEETEGARKDAARALEILPEPALRAYGPVLRHTASGDFAAALVAFERINRLSGGHLQEVIGDALASQVALTNTN